MHKQKPLCPPAVVSGCSHSHTSRLPGPRISKGVKFRGKHGRLRALLTGNALKGVPDLDEGAEITGTVVRQGELTRSGKADSATWVVTVDQWPHAGEVSGIPAPSVKDVIHTITEPEVLTTPPVSIRSWVGGLFADAASIIEDRIMPPDPTYDDDDINFEDSQDQRLITATTERLVGAANYTISRLQSEDDSGNVSQGYRGDLDSAPPVFRLRPEDAFPTNPGWIEMSRATRVDPVSGRTVLIDDKDFMGAPTDAWPIITKENLYDYDLLWMKWDNEEWWIYMAEQCQIYMKQEKIGLESSHIIRPPEPWELVRFIGIYRTDAALGRADNIMDRWDYRKHSVFNIHIAAALPWRRFCDIKRVFHLADNQKLSEKKFTVDQWTGKIKRNKRYYAKQKVFPAEEHYNERAALLYTMPYRVCEDETIVPSHHRSKMTNAGKGKPTKGVAIDELGSSIGYRFIGHMCVRDPGESIPGYGLGMNGFSAVMYNQLQALHTAGYRGLQFIADNLYNTPRIFNKINEDLGYRGVGTWRPNYGVWSALTMRGNKQEKKTRTASKGIHEKWSINLAFEKSLTYLSIVENNEFYMLYNITGQLGWVNFPRSISTYTEEGCWDGYSTFNDKKLIAQSIYNEGKIGVDQASQMLKRSRPRCPHNRRPELTVYLGIDGAAVLGLWAIHQFFAKRLGLASGDRITFQHNLGISMCRYHPSLFRVASKSKYPIHEKMGVRPVPTRWPSFTSWKNKYVAEISKNVIPLPICGKASNIEEPLKAATPSLKRRRSVEAGVSGLSGHELVPAQRCSISPRKKMKCGGKGELIRASGKAVSLPIPGATCAVCKRRGQRLVCIACGVGFCNPNSRHVRGGGGARQCFWAHTVKQNGQDVLVHSAATVTKAYLKECSEIENE